MSDPSVVKVVASLGAGLVGMLGIAKLLDDEAKRTVQEDPDNVGYYLDAVDSEPPVAVAIRSVPDDGLPTCPDYIPEWMLRDA